MTRKQHSASELVQSQNQSVTSPSPVRHQSQNQSVTRLSPVTDITESEWLRCRPGGRAAWWRATVGSLWPAAGPESSSSTPCSGASCPSGQSVVRGQRSVCVLQKVLGVLWMNLLERSVMLCFRVFGAVLLSDEKTSGNNTKTFYTEAAKAAGSTTLYFQLSDFWPRPSSSLLPAAVKVEGPPCWQLEEFVVTTECLQCNAFQSVSVKNCFQHIERPDPENSWWLSGQQSVTTAVFQRSWAACELTGYVERVNCTRTNRDEHKRWDAVDAHSETLIPPPF